MVPWPAIPRVSTAKFKGSPGSGVLSFSPPTLAMVCAHGCSHETWPHLWSTRAFSHRMVYEQGTGENRGENRIGGELAIRAKRKVRRRVKGRDNQTKIKVMLGVLAL